MAEEAGGFPLDWDYYNERDREEPVEDTDEEREEQYE
jgi:hypothetical protein